MKEAYPVDISPEEFERQVESWLKRVNDGMQSFRVTHREILDGRTGEYEIDAIARFEIFGGAKILTLIECKRHKNPIKRDVVMLLKQKMQETGAHKGMVFSTSEFQSGAIEFGTAHGIALVTVQDGKTNYHTRAEGLGKVDPPPWVHVSDYIGWVTRLNEEENESYSVVNDSRIEPLENWFSQQKEV